MFDSKWRQVTGIAASMAIAFGVMATLLPDPARAQFELATGTRSVLQIPDGTVLPASRKVLLGLHKAMIVELPVDARDVLVSHPTTIDAVVLTARKVFLLAKEVGEANVFFIGRDGQKLLLLDMTVRRDLTELSDMLHQLLPSARLKLSATGEGVVISGHAASPADASRAEEIASQYLKKAPVVNLIAVAAKEQVLLKVTVSEMQRDAVKRLGVSLPSTVAKAGAFTFAKVIQNGFPVTSGVASAAGFTGAATVPAVSSGSALQTTANWSGNSVTAILEALERVGLSRTLAEPTLTAISGETAKFLAGGEFPIPLAAANNTVSVSFKSFGIGVAFTPFVISEGRISLKVTAEVSELSSQGAVTVQSISVPAISVRRAETTVELSSGSALAIAGLLSEQTRQSVEGVPELKNLPVLGALFRSKDFRNNETELVIVVTPYLVRPTEPDQLSRADEGFAPSSELQGLFLGTMHRIYGPQTRSNGEHLRGDYGFIVEYPEEGEAG